MAMSTKVSMFKQQQQHFLAQQVGRPWEGNICKAWNGLYVEARSIQGQEGQE